MLAQRVALSRSSRAPSAGKAPAPASSAEDFERHIELGNRRETETHSKGEPHISTCHITNVQFNASGNETWFEATMFSAAAGNKQKKRTVRINWDLKGLETFLKTWPNGSIRPCKKRIFYRLKGDMKQAHKGNGESLVASGNDKGPLSNYNLSSQQPCAFRYSQNGHPQERTNCCEMKLHI